MYSCEIEDFAELMIFILFLLVYCFSAGRGGGTVAMGNKTKAATWGELLFSDSPALRRTLFLGLGLGIAQQASGSEAVVYYSPSVLDDAG